MRRNETLTPEEQDELESWVELSETIALVRAQALHVLRLIPERLRTGDDPNYDCINALRV